MSSSFTPAYTVNEYGVRYPGGRVDSLGTDSHFRTWRAVTFLVRARLNRRPAGQPVSRQVTGRDPLFTDGILAGLPLPKLKARYATHPGVPTCVDNVTEWKPGWAQPGPPAAQPSIAMRTST